MYPRAASSLMFQSNVSVLVTQRYATQRNICHTTHPPHAHTLSFPQLVVTSSH